MKVFMMEVDMKKSLLQLLNDEDIAIRKLDNAQINTKNLREERESWRKLGYPKPGMHPALKLSLQAEIDAATELEEVRKQLADYIMWSTSNFADNGEEDE